MRLILDQEIISVILCLFDFFFKSFVKYVGEVLPSHCGMACICIDIPIYRMIIEKLIKFYVNHITCNKINYQQSRFRQHGEQQ